MEILVGGLGASLLAALIALVYEHHVARQMTGFWENRARAAAVQLDELLARVSTTDRLRIEAGEHMVKIDPEARRFYADDDDPVEERAWNAARNGQEDDE